MQYRIIFCLLVVVLLVGTVSADTLILTAEHDGYVTENTDQSWVAMRNDIGDANVDSANLVNSRTKATDTVDVYSYNERGIVVWNTSILAGAAIQNAVVSISGFSKFAELGESGQSIIDCYPANPLDYANGDYDATTFTKMASDIPYASFSTNWNNFTLNAAGLEKINTSGYSSYMFSRSADTDNSSWTWVTYGASGYFYDSLTTVTKPFMTITYTSGATPPVASFTTSKTFIRIPNTVTVTDTSTNTPTSWEWSWGDGTANSTTQNPTHQYLKRGKWDIILTATNAGGSGTTTATSIKVAGYENYN